jgi:hypothetical protein
MRSFLVNVATFAREGLGAGWLPGPPDAAPLRFSDLLGVLICHALALLGLGAVIGALAGVIALVGRVLL